MPKPPKKTKGKNRIFSTLAGAFLLIPCIFGTAELTRHLLNFQFTDLIQLAFLTGMGVYAVMHLVLWKPIFIHVMGHELTHAFWAFVFGGRTKSLQVSSLGGQVTLSKTNFFVALAPYFFPFYTVLLVPFFLIALPKFQPWVSLLMGFTYAFHLALTLHSLREQQSDLLETGIIFSIIFIYFMNLFVLTLLVMLIAPALIQPLPFMREMVRDLAIFIHGIASWFTPGKSTP